MQVISFSNMAQCEAALLDELTLIMTKTLAQQTGFTLALAGGNTPKKLYEALSHIELDWKNIHITLTDERWVNADHEDSNENMLKQTLLQNQAQAANFLPLKNTQPTPEQGQVATHQLLLQHAPQLDAVILGMGDDGHFASIFPNMVNTQDLLDVTQSVLCLPANPENKPARMSLTLRYLLSAQRIFLFIKGEAKRQVLAQQSQENIKEPLPIHYLLKQTQCPVTVFWSAS